MRVSQLLRHGFVLILVTAVSACNGTGATSSRASGDSAAATPAATSGSTASVPTRSAASETIREVTLPAGTQLAVVLDTNVGSDTSHAEQTVHAHLAHAIEVDGLTAIPAGSRVSGVVTDATESGKVKGLAHVALRFDSLTPGGSDARYAIQTSAVGRTAESTKKKDALEIGGGAAGGAIIGALVGGSKGAAIGTAAGGGAGTAVVLSTRGKEIHLPQGSRLTLRLTHPLTVRVGG